MNGQRWRWTQQLVGLLSSVVGAVALWRGSIVDGAIWLCLGSVILLMGTSGEVALTRWQRGVLALGLGGALIGLLAHLLSDLHW